MPEFPTSPSIPATSTPAAPAQTSTPAPVQNGAPAGAPSLPEVPALAPTRQSLILADLTQVATPPAVGQPAAPAAPSVPDPRTQAPPTQVPAPTPSAPAPATQAPADPEEWQRGYLRSEDYAQRLESVRVREAEVARQRAELDQLRILYQPGQFPPNGVPAPGQQPPATFVMPATPQPPSLPFDPSTLNEDDFETDAEVALAQALKATYALQQHTVAQVQELQRQLGTTAQTAQQLAAQSQYQAQREAQQAIVGGVAAIQAQYGVSVTPEEAAQITQRWASALEQEFNVIAPEVIVRAFELQNFRTILASRGAAAPGVAPAVPGQPQVPAMPPELAPTGARSLPLDTSRLSRKDQILMDLMGGQLPPV